jgi:hypothetical protein
MAKNGFKVMDSDMHIVEPADLWERYIDPAFKDRAPRGLHRHPRDLGVQVGESVFPLPTRSYANAIAPLMTAPPRPPPPPAAVGQRLPGGRHGAGGYR